MNKDTIIIDDGSKRIEFKNNNDEVFAEFSFNPADPTIVTRYDEMIKFLQNYDYDKEEDSIEFIKRFNDDVAKAFNDLFRKDVATGLFKTYAPMSIMGNGDFYAEVLIYHIGQIIEKELDVKIKEKRAKIKKATAKYK